MPRSNLKHSGDYNKRILIVDVLRGFALIGVLVANFTAFTDQQVPTGVLRAISSPIDEALMQINAVLIEFKFVTLFSILFGFGFGTLIDKLEHDGLNAVSYFLRRMLWLFFFGLMHLLFWWFDVLHIYAIAGVLLLLFRNASNRVILGSAVFFLFVVAFVYSWMTSDRPEALTNSDYGLIYHQLKNGGLATLFKTNVIGYYRLFLLSGNDLYYLSETLGKFLLGFYLYRTGLFNQVEGKKKLFIKTLLITLPITALYYIVRSLAFTKTFSIEEFYWEPLIKLGILSTTVFYSCLLIIWFVASGSNRIFLALQFLGRMTLTNYLLISAIMITILYGVGFGKLGEIPMRMIWFYAGLWIVFEILLSRFWLKYFRFGPIEWIWRRLTYNTETPWRSVHK